MHDYLNVFCLLVVSEELFNLKLLTEPDPERGLLARPGLGPIVFTAYGRNTEPSPERELRTVG